jgi:DNA replication initiation complex subunit (GINS family)
VNPLQEKILELLKRYLEAEEQSIKVVKLPEDTYVKLASCMQSLRRTNNANGNELANRLIKKQVEILQGITNQLLDIRLEKAIRQDAINDLLLEERYISRFYHESKKHHDRFINAILNGQPSFFTITSKKEMSNKIVVRFLKPVSEIIGFDLKRYGPFKVHDLAVVPFGNANVLVKNKEASPVYIRESLYE